MHVGQTANNLEEYCSDSCENCDMQIHVLFFFFALLDVRNLWNG